MSSDQHVVTTGRPLVIPASPAQQGLWLQDSIDPGQSAYTVSAAIRLRGDLRLDILERALNTVIERHEVLRTVFDLRGDDLMQIIAARPPLAVRISEVTAEDAEAVLRQEAATPFDLRTGPLVRARLLRLAPDHHLLVISIHHIVTDGESSAVLVREFSEAYAARLAGREPLLEELPLQYADYAVWQRQMLTGEHREKLLSYWSERLRGVPALELPIDRRRAGARSARGATHRFTIPARVVQRCQDVARERRATLFMTLLAGFLTVLSRYCGQEDLTVTTPMSGRERPELEDLIGYFMNAVLLRTDLAGDPTFGDLVSRVRTTCLEAMSHQELPYQQAIELLRKEGSGGDRLHGQVGFLVQPARALRWRAGDLDCELLPTDVETAKSDLFLEVRPGDDGYAGMIEYSTDVFDRTTVERLAGHLTALWEAAGDQPDHPLSQLLAVAVPAETVPSAAPPAPGDDPESGYVAPRTPFEEEVAAIWGEVLGWDRVGVHDNFFDLAGHSLMAVRLAARIEESFGVKINMRQLLGDFTVAAVAQHLFDLMAAEDEVR